MRVCVCVCVWQLWRQRNVAGRVVSTRKVGVQQVAYVHADKVVISVAANWCWEIVRLLHRNLPFLCSLLLFGLGLGLLDGTKQSLEGTVGTWGFSSRWLLLLLLLGAEE